MPKLTRDVTWVGDITQPSKSQEYTFLTGGKYVDKDIAIKITAANASMEGSSISGGELTHGDIIATDSEYLQDEDNGLAISFSNSANVGKITSTFNGVDGWIEAGTTVAETEEVADDIKTLTKYIKKGSAAIDENQSIVKNPTIKLEGSNIIADYSGSKSITGSVTPGWIDSLDSETVTSSGSTTVPAASLDSNLIPENIVSGTTIFGIEGTATPTEIGGTATFSNVGTDGVVYTDISTTAPVLISDDYLYINEGFTTNKKISLAKLVPNDANITASEGASYLLSGKTAYDSDGKLISGTMGNATVTSGAANITGTNVGDLDESSNKFPMTLEINVSEPTIINGGYLDQESGTTNPNNNQTITIELDEGKTEVAGGELTAGAGSSSINVNGYFDGSSVSEEDIIEFSDVAIAGYYKIGTTGKGTVNRAAITESHTAGWIAEQDETEIKEATSLSSNSGTSIYYVKKSTGAATEFTPTESEQSVTIGAGYYPSDRTIKVNPIDYSKVNQGVLDITESAFTQLEASSVEKTDYILDEEKWQCNIPISINASATASVKVTSNGYVDDNKNASKTISKSENTSISLDLYDGSFLTN